MSPTVAGTDGTDQPDPATEPIERWCDVARTTLEGEGVIEGHLDLHFVDRPDMTELNRVHMGADGPTDVLAFPLDGPTVGSVERSGGPSSGCDGGGAGAPIHLGDVVVCAPVARSQAADHCGSVEAELTLLIIHGVLHVLGHDHAELEETTEMQGRERVHLARYGFEHPVPA